jgi:phosphoglycerate dehydrogenase-like enzyme
VAVRDLPRWQGARKILLRDMGVDLQELTAGHEDVEFVIVRNAVEAMQQVRDADAIVGFCDGDLIDAAERLVWVQIYWAGAEGCLSQERLGSGEVVLTNMQKMSSPVIAEHAIAMMMALARHLPQFVHKMDDGAWDDSNETLDGMTPIAGKKLLVVGLGGIGTEVARLGAALGMHVSGTRNSSRSGPSYIEYIGLSNELLALAAEADVVVNALPLTDDTRGLFDAGFFAAVKPGTIFVNVGRGQTVDTDELVKALESGRVAAAGLDVTDPEPLAADNPLWRRDDVIITPHVAGVGGERERHRVLLLENLRRFIAGDRLLNVVDPAKGY